MNATRRMNRYNHRKMSVALAAALCASVAWWLAGLFRPRRLILLPYGDIALGFRSYAGRLEWIEYASWGLTHDYPIFSVSWIAIITVESILLAYIARKTT